MPRMLPLSLLLILPLHTLAAAPDTAPAAQACGYTLHYSITRYEQSVLFEAPDRPALWVTDLELRIDGRRAQLEQEQRPALTQLRATAGALTETLHRTGLEVVELAGWETLAALQAAGQWANQASDPSHAADTIETMRAELHGDAVDQNIAAIVTAVLEGAGPDDIAVAPYAIDQHVALLRQQLDVDQALSCTQLETLDQLQSRLPGLRLLSAS